MNGVPLLIDELLIASGIAQWILIALLGAVLLAVLRIVGTMQTTHDETVQELTIGIGRPLPDFTAVRLSDRSLVTREDLLGSSKVLLFVSPTCSACENVIGWVTSNSRSRDWLIMIAAEPDLATDAASLYGVSETAFAEADLGFLDTFAIRGVPFAVAVDQVGAVEAARFVSSPSDIEQRLVMEEAGCRLHRLADGPG